MLFYRPRRGRENGTNRKVFITELNKYLASVPGEQRDAVINKYEALFDEAGPEKESELINKFDSPLKVAIAVLREKDNSPLTENDYERTDKATETEVLPELSPEDEAEKNETEDKKDTQTETIEENAAGPENPDPEDAREPDEHCLPGFEAREDDVLPAEIGYEENEDGPDDIYYDYFDDEADEHEKASAVIGKVFASAGLTILSVLVVILSVSLTALLPVPLIAVGSYVIFAGFSSFSYMPDALLLLGAGSMAFSAGAAIAWLFIHGCVSSLIVIIDSMKNVTSQKALPGRES